MTRPIALALAEEMVALREQGAPGEVEERARALLGDFLGVALGGAPEASSRAVREALAAIAETGAATVLGCRERLTPAGAALANGAAAHALEMDDTHQAGSIHLGACVLAAALAAGEHARASGRAVLRAAIAGYEVAGRLAMALDPAAHYARGFHPTGTCGAFGAATAAALLMGADATALAAALGIAGSQAAGSMEFLANGAWTKRLHPGWAAAAGLHAGALACAGFRAPASVFEGRFGTLHAYSDRAAAAALAPSGEWAVMRTSVKPHACCRYVQGPIDATLALRRRHGVRPRDAVRIEVGLVQAGFPIVCEPLADKRRPASVVDAQFSLPFGVAIALVDGDASPDRFSAARWSDPVVQHLMDAVEPVPDPALDARYPRVWPAWVRLHAADGRTWSEQVDHPRGDPENFPSAAELDAKFRTLAGRSLPPPAVDVLAERLATVAEAGDLVPLLAAASVT